MKTYLLNVILIVLLCFLGWEFYKAKQTIKRQHIEIIEQEDKNLITNLKQDNKYLYDSLQYCKDKIEYLVNFKYQKEYIIDTVYCDTTSIKGTTVFSYENEKNDTLQYKLDIASITEPAWYKLALNVSNEFTIVNKKNNKLNETSILAKDGGEIKDVTIINTKPKKTFFEKFRLEPSITMGYSLINHNIDLIIGASLIYDFER